jgi:hypothetical protein
MAAEHLFLRVARVKAVPIGDHYSWILHGAFESKWSVKLVSWFENTNCRKNEIR